MNKKHYLAAQPEGRVIRRDAQLVAKKGNALTVRKPCEILAMDFDPADLYLENGIIARGQSTTILGPGGIGKSRLLLQLAVSSITGRDCIGFKVGKRRLRWLIIQTENSNRRLKADFERLRGSLNEADWKRVDANLHIHTIENDHDAFLGLDDPVSRERVAQLIRDTKADVVVFDPLSAFTTGNLNSDAVMVKTCKALTQIARAGNPDCSIIVLHHTLTGKAGVKKAVGWDRASYGRGSKALHAWTRGQINLAPASAEGAGTLVVSCGKNSNAEEFVPFGIKLNLATMIYEVDPEFDLDTWKAEVDGTAPPKLKPTPDAIADLVKDLPLKRKALLGLVMETFGCEKSTAYARIDAADGKTIHRNDSKEYVKI